MIPREREKGVACVNFVKNQNIANYTQREQDKFIQPSKFETERERERGEGGGEK